MKNSIAILIVLCTAHIITMEHPTALDPHSLQKEAWLLKKKIHDAKKSVFTNPRISDECIECINAHEEKIKDRFNQITSKIDQLKILRHNQIKGNIPASNSSPISALLYSIKKELNNFEVEVSYTEKLIKECLRPQSKL